MGKLLSFKSHRAVYEEASVWLSRMDRGLTAEERAALQGWVGDDPRHAKALVSMAALWDQMDLMGELSGLMELPARPAPRSANARYAWLAGATAASAVLVGALLLNQNGMVPSSPDPTLLTIADRSSTTPSPVSGIARTSATYETNVGEKRTESLPDGSIVQLNTNSRIELSFRPTERDIVVRRGEAHFEVQHDASRPFLVTAAGRRIRAVGTAFNVRLEADGRLEVTVTEGQILVSTDAASGRAREPGSPAHEARVSAGEQLQADVSNRAWRVERLVPETMTNRLAWQRGMLIFDGQQLEQALEEVSRYSDVRFEIRDADLRQVRVGGAYKPDDVDSLVRSLERNLGIVATRLPDGLIVISRRAVP